VDPVSILLLDDSPLDADLITNRLSVGGVHCRVTRVETEPDFRRMLERLSFELIIAEYSLPGFSGLAALRIAREHFPHKPFIFVSSARAGESAGDTIKYGATAYVLKRELDRLVPAVNRALADYPQGTKRESPGGRFESMADAAPVMIWTAGADQKLDYVNKTWLDFCGQPVKAALGDGWLEGIHPDDLARCLESYRAAFLIRRPFTIEYRLLRYDGEYRWVVNNGNPRFGLNGEFLGYIGSCMDVTELKRTEERIRHSAKLESLGILAGGIAHDFNNILTGILGSASLLADELTPGTMQAQLVDNIMRSSERAAQLTRQMLAYSGKGRFMIEPLDLSAQVREITALLRVSIPRNVEFKLDLQDGLPLIEADPGQIQQLVMNLVINGAEAIGPEGGSLRVATLQREFTAAKMAVVDEYFAPGRYVVLEVRDSGHGMDAETRAKIFDPFFTTRFTGRGLGLAAVSGIVRSQKGAIDVESEPGVGTAFYVYLPAVKASVEAESQKATASVSRSADSPAGRSRPRPRSIRVSGKA
jgi:two-component system cell cycle sensor histidine kinase/response regulator CckA